MQPFFLTSERLGFRPWTRADLPLAQQLWGDPEVARYIHAHGVFSAAEVAARLERELATQAERGIQYWPVFRLEPLAFAGCCGLRPADPGPEVLELGFHLRPAFWHQGYAREAAARVIDYAFHDLGTRTLVAGHHPSNAASRALLRRLGFQYRHDAFYAPTGLMHPSYVLPTSWSGDGAAITPRIPPGSGR